MKISKQHPSSLSKWFSNHTESWSATAKSLSWYQENLFFLHGFGHWPENLIFAFNQTATYSSLWNICIKIQLLNALLHTWLAPNDPLHVSIETGYELQSWNILNLYWWIPLSQRSGPFQTTFKSFWGATFVNNLKESIIFCQHNSFMVFNTLILIKFALDNFSTADKIFWVFNNFEQ